MPSTPPSKRPASPESETDRAAGRRKATTGCVASSTAPSLAGIVNIADREADMYELFMHTKQLRHDTGGEAHLLVRAQHNRQIEGQEQRLWAHLREQRAMADWSVHVPARKDIRWQQR